MCHTSTGREASFFQCHGTDEKPINLQYQLLHLSFHRVICVEKLLNHIIRCYKSLLTWPGLFKRWISLSTG